MEHARLSPSSSLRWLNCSYSIDKNLENTATEASIEGTNAHALAEHCLTNGIHAVNCIGEQIGTFIVQEEMATEVQKYINYCRNFQTEDTITMIETRFDLSDIIPEGFGTSDCVVFNKTTGELNVFDLKYGFLRVDAYMNSQLYLYAYGAYKLFKDDYDVKSIILHIHQPRINSISVSPVSVKRLLGFILEVNIVGERIKRGEQFAYPSADVCAYCSFKPHCDIYKERGTQMLQEIIKPNDITTLTDSQKLALLENEKEIKSVIGAVKSEIMIKLSLGHKVPGWKLVRKDGTRKWNKDAKKILTEDYPEFIEERLISVARADKLLQSLNLSRDVIEKYSTASDGGYDLVRDIEG